MGAAIFETRLGICQATPWNFELQEDIPELQCGFGVREQMMAGDRFEVECLNKFG